MMLRITLLFCLATGTLAQVVLYGSCPSVNVVTDFDGARYMGKWYEAAKYFAIFQLGGKCVTANYSLNDNGTVTVRNSQIMPLSGIEATITGLAKFSSNTSEAKLTVNFPSLPVSIDAPYWIIGTDYDNWAAVWSCTNFGFYSFRFAWLLTREQNPSATTISTAYATFDVNNISRTFFLKTDQANC